MNPYPTYPQAGYASHYPSVVPPNQFYALPPGTQQYNGYTAPYRRHRRPSDPGSNMQEPKLQAPRRGRSSRRPEEEIPRISRPMMKKSMRSGITPGQSVYQVSSIDGDRIYDFLRLHFYYSKLTRYSENCQCQLSGVD